MHILFTNLMACLLFSEQNQRERGLPQKKGQPGLRDDQQLEGTLKHHDNDEGEPFVLSGRNNVSMVHSQNLKRVHVINNVSSKVHSLAFSHCAYLIVF